MPSRLYCAPVLPHLPGAGGAGGLPARRGEEGAAVIEAVFALPLVLLMVAGVLDLSALVKCRLSLDSAATAAVRYCMDIPEMAGDPAAVKSYLASIDPASVGIER